MLNDGVFFRKDKMPNRRKVGSEYEEKAVRMLKEKGVSVLETNFFYRGGEIDIIAKDGEYICFIEVKYRSSIKMGYPEEAVTNVKKMRIVKGAKVYLYKNHLSESVLCRFDVISILGDKVEWIKNAFFL